ncbi:hypothetical protein [Rhodoglobus sp.]
MDVPAAAEPNFLDSDDELVDEPTEPTEPDEPAEPDEPDELELESLELFVARESLR